MFRKSVLISVNVFVLLGLIVGCSTKQKTIPRTKIEFDEFDAEGKTQFVGPVQGRASGYILFGFIPLGTPSRQVGFSGSSGGPLASLSHSLGPQTPIEDAAYYDAIESASNADALVYPRIHSNWTDYFVIKKKETVVEGKAIRFVPDRPGGQNFSDQGKETGTAREELRERQTSDQEEDQNEADEEPSIGRVTPVEASPSPPTTSSGDEDPSGTESESQEKDWRTLFESGKEAYNNENYAKAETLLKQAVQKRSDAAMLKVWLAASLMERGKKEEARENAQKALDQQSDLPTAEKILERTSE